MNQDIIEGNWKQIKGEVQKQWGKLTDDYLDQINGSRQKLLGALQETYGYAQDEAEAQIKRWEEENRSSRPGSCCDVH